MRIRTSFWLSLLFLAVVVTAIGEDVTAQTMKIGIVHDARIEQEYKAFTKVTEDYNIAYQAWEEEATTIQQELDDLVEEYERQKLILSEEKRAEKEAAIDSKRESLDAYTKRIFGPGGTAYQKQDQLLQPLVEKVREAIKAVAVEGEFDIVFTDQTGWAYIKEYVDITDDVLRYLEENE